MRRILERACGAVLSVWASILDGCDGEVARLKLLESDFGCWLETVCDYLYYLFIFAGMTIGLIRSSDEKMYLIWGILLLFGAVMSFLVTGLGRHRLAAGRPEQYLRNLAGESGKQAIEPDSVFRSIYRVHYPALFHAVCSLVLCCL